MIRTTHARAAVVWNRAERAEPPSASEPALLVFLSSASRLENAHELCAKFGLTGESSIEEILLVGWQHWGESLPSKLRGPFAFGIFDLRQHRLFAARDALGEAPLFYHSNSDHVVLAETSRLVRGLATRHLDHDLAVCASFLNGAHVDRQTTFFTGLRRLPAGSWVEFLRTSDGSSERYWSPHANVRVREAGAGIEQFRDIFDRSVLRKYKAGQTALMLSGGLDSSAILGSLIAQGIDPSGLPCLVKTYRESGGWEDERYLSSLRQRFGLDVLEVPSDLHDPLSDMDRWLEVLDGPYVSYGHSVASNLLRVAEREGWTNILSGHGGDEVVGYGLGRLNELARAKRWLQLWQETAGIASLSGQSRIRVMRKYMTHIPLYRRVELRLLRHFPDAEEVKEPSLCDEAIGLLNSSGAEPTSVMSRSDHDDLMVQIEALEDPIQQLALETIGQCSRSAGVETAMPFYDLELIELSLSLPSDLKLRDGRTRFVLREAMRDRLPDDVLKRQDKYDFTSPFVAGLLAHREKVLDWTGGQCDLLTDLANGARLKRIRHNLAHSGTELNREDARFIWRCSVLAIWQHQLKTLPAGGRLEGPTGSP